MFVTDGWVSEDLSLFHLQTGCLIKLTNFGLNIWGWNWRSPSVSASHHKVDAHKPFRDWPDPRSPELGVSCSFSSSQVFHVLFSCQHPIPWQGWAWIQCLWAFHWTDWHWLVNKRTPSNISILGGLQRVLFVSALMFSHSTVLVCKCIHSIPRGHEALRASPTL